MVGGWKVGWMDGQIDGWIDGWMDGWIGGWLDGWIDRSSYIFSPFLWYLPSPRSIISKGPSAALGSEQTIFSSVPHNTLLSLLSHYCPPFFLLFKLHPHSSHIFTNSLWLLFILSLLHLFPLHVCVCAQSCLSLRNCRDCNL